MERNFNLPPGCTERDIDGEPMPLCEKCGEEFTDWKGDGVCDDCRAPEEMESE